LAIDGPFSTKWKVSTEAGQLQVQWDGKYVTVDDQMGATVYQYSVKDGVATNEGKTPLVGSSLCGQSWITGSSVICPDTGNSELNIYNYPAGGYPTKTYNSPYAYGATVIYTQ
jgi:hypothetical protein